MKRQEVAGELFQGYSYYAVNSPFKNLKMQITE